MEHLAKAFLRPVNSAAPKQHKAMVGPLNATHSKIESRFSLQPKIAISRVPNLQTGPMMNIATLARPPVTQSKRPATAYERPPTITRDAVRSAFAPPKVNKPIQAQTINEVEDTSMTASRLDEISKRALDAKNMRLNLSKTDDAMQIKMVNKALSDHT